MSARDHHREASEATLNGQASDNGAPADSPVVVPLPPRTVAHPSHRQQAPVHGRRFRSHPRSPHRLQFHARRRRQRGSMERHPSRIGQELGTASSQEDRPARATRHRQATAQQAGQSAQSPDPTRHAPAAPASRRLPAQIVHGLIRRACRAHPEPLQRSFVAGIQSPRRDPQAPRSPPRAPLPSSWAGVNDLAHALSQCGSRARLVHRPGSACLVYVPAQRDRLVRQHRRGVGLVGSYARQCRLGCRCCFGRRNRPHPTKPMTPEARGVEANLGGKLLGKFKRFSLNVRPASSSGATSAFGPDSAATQDRATGSGSSNSHNLFGRQPNDPARAPGNHDIPAVLARRRCRRRQADRGILLDGAKVEPQGGARRWRTWPPCGSHWSGASRRGCTRRQSGPSECVEALQSGQPHGRQRGASASVADSSSVRVVARLEKVAQPGGAPK
ncbi:hypothetical protein L1887_53239 [Cichorium endivia]|nr:hypothetical protein L1887_53239 [Cichorium endivia]